MIISKFKLNREKKINFLRDDLVNFMNNFNSSDDYKKFLSLVSGGLRLKKKTLEHETKIILFDKSAYSVRVITYYCICTSSFK